MNNFLQQLEDDLKNVFLNQSEFAQNLNIHYDGDIYENIPVVVDEEEAKNRSTGKGKANDIDEIYEIDAVAYIGFSDLGIIPKKNHEIIFENREANTAKKYTISSSNEDTGLITLELLEYDE